MKNIAKLIGKFNVATLAIITFLYIGCLVLILIAINPKYSYYVEPNYSHHTEYSELNNSFQVVYKRTFNGEKVLESYSIRTAINSRTSETDKTDQQFTIVKYQSELKQVNGNEYYLSEVSSGTTSWARTSSVGEGHEPKAYFGKVNYIDSNGVRQIKTFKEEIFDKPKNLKDYTNGNFFTFDDVQFRFFTVASKDGDDYLVTMRISTTTVKHFHIDMQSWLITDDELLPFVGVYGHNNGTWSVASERVISNLGASGIACKLICYFDDQEYEIHYKANFSDMEELLANVEEIEAPTCNVFTAKAINKVIAISAVALTIVCISVVVVLGAIRAKRAKKEQNDI